MDKLAKSNALGSSVIMLSWMYSVCRLDNPAKMFGVMYAIEFHSRSRSCRLLKVANKAASGSAVSKLLEIPWIGGWREEGGRERGGILIPTCQQ